MIRLRQTEGADSGRELEFDKQLVRIGRMPDSDLNFDPEVDLDASGRHAEIRSEGGRYLLIDMGSRNGTWLNGQRIKHAALHAGDEIEFGRGGPKLRIASIENGSSSPVRKDRITLRATRRDSRFDPLAMPVTTATHLKDLDARVNPLTGPPPTSKDTRREPRSRRRPSLVMLWGAAGIVFLTAIAIVVGVSFR
ncbi:MAG: FHA domain-containing protein [Polyangiales bacterium]